MAPHPSSQPPLPITSPPLQPSTHVVDVPVGPPTNYRIKAVTGIKLLKRLVFTLLIPLAAIKLQSPALTADYAVQVCCLVVAGFLYCVLVEMVENPDNNYSPKQDYIEMVLQVCLIIISVSLLTLLLQPNQSLPVFIPSVSVLVPLTVAVWFRADIIRIFSNCFGYVMSMKTTNANKANCVPRVSA